MYLTCFTNPSWVRETSTHTETQGKNAKPTINPSSQQEVHSFQGRMCMLKKPVKLSRALKKVFIPYKTLLNCLGWVLCRFCVAFPVHPCPSMPLHAPPCPSMPLHAPPCPSMSLHSNWRGNSPLFPPALPPLKHMKRCWRWREETWKPLLSDCLYVYNTRYCLVKHPLILCNYCNYFFQHSL